MVVVAYKCRPYAAVTTLQLIYHPELVEIRLKDEVIDTAAALLIL